MSDKCYMCGADATGTDSEGEICIQCYAAKERLKRQINDKPTITGETVNSLKSEIASLKAELEDIRNATLGAMDEACGTEKHCSCVPLLREEVKLWKKNCEERAAEGGKQLIQIMKLQEERDQWRTKARELLVEICENEAPTPTVREMYNTGNLIDTVYYAKPVVKDCLTTEQTKDGSLRGETGEDPKP